MKPKSDKTSNENTPDNIVDNLTDNLTDNLPNNLADNKQESHKPVLLTETIEGLNLQPGSRIIDATFGRGGHSAAIAERIQPDGELLVIDRDPTAIAAAKQQFAQQDKRHIEHAGYDQILEICEKYNWIGKVDGILIDCGVSSPQLDEAERGFSFRNDGPLDMRMDTTQGETAAQWLEKIKQDDLANVLYKFGDERYSRRIAKAIIEYRQQAATRPAITRTQQLAEIIKAAHPRWSRDQHPATRSFQAIRIAINRELAQLQSACEQAVEVLRPGGRLVIISFHSLEDRIVKQLARKHKTENSHPPDLPIKNVEIAQPKIKQIGKMFTPSKQECKTNPRARSARCRILEKT